jgi:hypothetical protein
LVFDKNTIAIFGMGEDEINSKKYRKMAGVV